MKSLSLFTSISLTATLLFFATGCQTSPLRDEASSKPLNAASANTDSNATGPVTTASGLQYQVLESGPAEGRSPTIHDSVTVHYRGTLTDGSVFDSSLERGEPATFGVGQVIPGWTEALQLMKPGDTWMLHIPAHLAYGNRAMGNKIPANSDLIFQVQLLSIAGGR